MFISKLKRGCLMVKFNKIRLFFGLLLIILIGIGEVVCHALHLPAWPAFFVMIFFFVEERNMKKAPHILIGGAFGILLIIAAGLFIPFLMRLGFAQFTAFLIFVLLFVYSIIALGEIIPWLFNNYAFMAILFAGTYMKTPGAQNPIILAAILMIGGVVFIAGILGIEKIVIKVMAPPANPE